METEKAIQTKINKKYKDRVFCLIFGREEYRKNALSLYNAVNGSSYEEENDLIIYTLSDAIYIKMKNDVDYLFHDVIALYEQQSTINPNMPIRGLLYFAEMYSKYITEKKYNIYGRTLVRIPNPQYVVFYNGTDRYDDKELKLSDAFIEKDDTGRFEWTASIVNLNDPQNEVRKSCSVLNEYMIFVEKIREYAKTMSSENAVDAAVVECIGMGVLADILQKHRAEVRKMIITEFDEEVFIKGMHEEGKEEQAKKTAIRMKKMGMDIAVIAEALDADEETVLQWLS